MLSSNVSAETYSNADILRLKHVTDHQAAPGKPFRIGQECEGEADDEGEKQEVCDTLGPENSSSGA